MEDNSLSTNQLGALDNMVLEGDVEGAVKMAQSMASTAKKQKAQAAAVALGDNPNNPALKLNHHDKYRHCWPIPGIDWAALTSMSEVARAAHSFLLERVHYKYRRDLNVLCREHPALVLPPLQDNKSPIKTIFDYHQTAQSHLMFLAVSTTFVAFHLCVSTFKELGRSKIQLAEFKAKQGDLYNCWNKASKKQKHSDRLYPAEQATLKVTIRENGALKVTLNAIAVNVVGEGRKNRFVEAVRVGALWSQIGRGRK